MESLTASSWPFFLVQMYFPLLAFSATLWLSHSTENMVFAELHWKREKKKQNLTFLGIKCFIEEKLLNQIGGDTFMLL